MPASHGNRVTDASTSQGAHADWGDLVCPADHATLDWFSDMARCSLCDRVFPIQLGFPDFRLTPDPYLSNADDLAAATRLAANEASMTYDALLESYYATNSKVSPEMARRFAHGARSGEPRARMNLVGWRAMGLRCNSTLNALDLGCGTGALATVLASEGVRVTGIDTGLRWLVIARARARDAGQNVRLVCANAEALPFADGSHAVVAGESIVENVPRQRQLFAGIARVLAPTGQCALYVPNKFSPAPDPHLGVPWGGMLPAAWSAAIARRRGDVPPVRAMLGRSRLRRLFEAAELPRVRFTLPTIAPEQLALASPVVRRAAALYERLGRTPLVRHVVLAIAPSWIVLAERGAAHDPSATTSTAPR